MNLPIHRLHRTYYDYYYNISPKANAFPNYTTTGAVQKSSDLQIQGELSSGSTLVIVEIHLLSMVPRDAKSSNLWYNPKAWYICTFGREKPWLALS